MRTTTLFLLSFFLFGCGNTKTPETTNIQPSATEIVQENGEKIPAYQWKKKELPTPEEKDEIYTVTKIEDDFSITAQINETEEKIRIAGIDFPQGEECYAEETKKYLEKKLLGKEFKTLDDKTLEKRNEKNELVRHIFVGTEEIAIDLIRKGYVNLADNSLHSRSQEHMYAFSEAQGTQVGMWNPNVCSPAQ